MKSILRVRLKHTGTPSANGLTDYLMVGLRYGFYPRVTDVISQTSEIRASE